VHPRSVADNVLSQTADAGSLLSFYKEMLALRRQHAALHSGRLDLLPRTQNDVLAYRRFCDEEALTVQLNFSAEPQAVTLPAGATVLASTHGKDGAMSIPADGRSTLRPFEARILR
jgi:glycosidase